MPPRPRRPCAEGEWRGDKRGQEVVDFNLRCVIVRVPLSIFSGLMMSGLRIFISYCHKDKKWLERLQVHLAPLSRDYELEVWDDSKLGIGSQWRDEIRKAVEGAHIAILIVSADFLASEFIHNDELPPLLQAAKEEGTIILPIIASPCLFKWQPKIANFQAANDPSAPLNSITEAEQEEIFVKVATTIIQAVSTPSKQEKGEESKEEVVQEKEEPFNFRIVSSEDFLNHQYWTKLIKIGDWILDEDGRTIIGSGMRSYLLSRNEYGATPFTIECEIEFSNFKRPMNGNLGMNSGIVFGWKSEGQVDRYYNIRISGEDILIEKIGFNGGSVTRDFEHLHDPVPLQIQQGGRYSFSVAINDSLIKVSVNGEEMISHPRETGAYGRVGLRPWRSKMDCTKFVAISDLGKAAIGSPH